MHTKMLHPTFSPHAYACMGHTQGVPQLLRMLTIASASVLADVHPQLQAPVRTVEEKFLWQQHEKGIQQHSGAPEKKRRII